VKDKDEGNGDDFDKSEVGNGEHRPLHRFPLPQIIYEVTS